ncbi:hypothetical protein N825_37400 [Skermanella stibiiresistens SB22]|uniref:Uncharacterized protein n=1 Tax=Skermanella stibiiresistens SB22 TaxID=1385369 RepID=W9GSS7_9PROT|nr:hypothetical protein [Skermanella stibiiresistens]EWY35711.1 hypothetical protein N825_37400 [Skermanella stibiiresistens SB22]
MISETNDADIFEISSYDYGNKTITGFNGVGAYGGDRLYISSDYYDDPEPVVREVSGKTIVSFSWKSDAGPVSQASYTIAKVGLMEEVDYFFN